jgi:hypothetical protein
VRPPAKLLILNVSRKSRGSYSYGEYLRGRLERMQAELIPALLFQDDPVVVPARQQTHGQSRHGLSIYRRQLGVLADRGVDESPGLLGGILQIHSDRFSQSQSTRRSPDDVIANLPAHPPQRRAEVRGRLAPAAVRPQHLCREGSRHPRAFERQIGNQALRT